LGFTFNSSRSARAARGLENFVRLKKESDLAGGGLRTVGAVYGVLFDVFAVLANRSRRAFTGSVAPMISDFHNRVLPSNTDTKIGPDDM
jgi:hypothetical protein